MSLVETMSDTFALVQKHNNLHQSKSQIILQMVQQTTECGWFIHNYTKIQQFCQSYYFLACSFVYQAHIGKRTVTNAITDSSAKVDQFKAKFAELQAAFIAENIVQVELEVLRVAEDVTSLKEKLDDLGVYITTTFFFSP